MGKVTYDPNGNITKYIRNNGHYAAGTTDGVPMDSLFYNYNAGTNQLNQVRDLVSPWPAGYYYLHDQPVNNYSYDAIGNIIKDSIQSLSKIAWNVYGKITEIDHASPPTWNESKTIYYYYDASGNRIGKKVTQGNNKNANYSWYVRDASGNVMSSYTMTGDSTVAQSTLTLNQEYHYMYGSGRLGMHSVFSAVNAADNGTSAYSVPWAGQYYGWRRSKKYYELTNHLGNVMMTLSDAKAGVKQSTNASLIDHYNAVKLTETDYYPFGMQMGERTSASFTANYRYGFNGKEQDDEVKGIGNQIDYGMRVYDPRLGRFLSLDPLTKKYPELAPYQYASNTPIVAIDIDGAEGMISLPDEATSRLTTIAAQPVINFIHQKHAQGMLNVSIAENARQTAIRQGRINGDGINWWTKSLLYIAPWWNSAAPFTHANDGAVLLSGKNLDNSKAEASDYAAATLGIFIPVVSGAELKKGGSALIEGVIQVFRNGKEIEQPALKIGKYGYKGTKAYTSVINAVKSGGNIVANSKAEALKFLEEALPGILDETGKKTSSFGYRIDNDVIEETKEGLKQGHQGLHINYYDKKREIEGTILIEETKKN